MNRCSRKFKGVGVRSKRPKWIAAAARILFFDYDLDLGRGNATKGGGTHGIDPHGHHAPPPSEDIS
jgi:hypothetical protein